MKAFPGPPRGQILRWAGRGTHNYLNPRDDQETPLPPRKRRKLRKDETSHPRGRWCTNCQMRVILSHKCPGPPRRRPPLRPGDMPAED